MTLQGSGLAGRCSQQRDSGSLGQSMDWSMRLGPLYMPLGIMLCPPLLKEVQWDRDASRGPHLPLESIGSFGEDPRCAHGNGHS